MKLLVLSFSIICLVGCSSTPPELSQPAGPKTLVATKIYVSELLKK